MITDKTKLIALGLALTLVGGAVGAYTTRSFSSAPQPVAQATQPTAPATQPAAPAVQPEAMPQVQMPAQLQPGQTYQLVPVGTAPGQPTTTQPASEPAPKVVTRTRTVSRTSARTSPQRSYYTYEEPKKQSFWSRHRDILTVAAGAGTGAAIGGLAGGKKGAGIGAIAGGVGSAVYTYGIRKRN